MQRWNPPICSWRCWRCGLRLGIGDIFFFVIFVSFYIFYVDVFFWWFGLNQVFCFMGIRGWHEFWMVGRVGNGGCGMGATIVQPATSCEAWIVKTQLRDVIVVRNFASLWFVPIPNSSACSISGSGTGASRMQINENRNGTLKPLLLLGCRLGEFGFPGNQTWLAGKSPHL